MATIGNLGAADSSRIVRKERVKIELPDQPRFDKARMDALAAALRDAEIQRLEEVPESRDSSNGRVRAMDESKEQFKRMSFEELAEMLQKVNLTFDLFEIQARYQIDKSSGDITVEVINQRTGEVIRKIPPYDVPKITEALKNGESIVTDITA